MTPSGSSQLFGPYLHFPKFAIILALYIPYAFLPEIAPSSTAQWLMMLVGLSLLASISLRATPGAERVPLVALSVWVLADMGIFLFGQWLTEWRGPTVFAGLFLVADAAMAAWRFHRGAVHMVISAAALFAGPLFTGKPADSTYWINFLAPMVAGCSFVYAFVVMGGRMGEERMEAARARTETELANTHLREYAGKVEELAVVRERSRLAREVHDTIAHAFTGIIMQLEAVNRLMEKDPARASSALADVQNQARDALAEVRRSVHALRPLELEERHGVAAIRRLAEDFAGKTGVQVTLQVIGGVKDLSTAQELCLYRTIQEGLTNAFRHGRASAARVVMHYTDEQVTVTITDDGRGPGAVSAKPGIGIMGMQERAAALGGTVTTAPGPKGGFQLEVILPLMQHTGGDGSTWESA